jgi:hypothetical protein
VLEVLRPSLVKVWMFAGRKALLTDDAELVADLEVLSRRRGIRVPWPGTSLKRLELDPQDEGEWAWVTRLSTTVKLLTGSGRGGRHLFTTTQDGMTLLLTDEEYGTLRTRLGEQGIDPDVVVKERVIVSPATPGWHMVFALAGLLVALIVLVFGHFSVGLAVFMALYLAIFLHALVRSTRLWLTDRRST